MIEGKTKSGFAYSISDENVNNMELLDALAEAEDGNPLRSAKCCTCCWATSSARSCMAICERKTAAFRLKLL